MPPVNPPRGIAGSLSRKPGFWDENAMQKLGLLLSGYGSALSGDQRYVQTNMAFAEMGQAQREAERRKKLTAEALGTMPGMTDNMKLLLQEAGPEGALSYLLAQDKRDAEPPKSRTRAEGDQDVFETWDPSAGAFIETSRAPRWQTPRPETEPLVQVADPNDPSRGIYVPRSQAIGRASPQTVRERMPKMQTYWAEDGTSIQLDSNDPEDQKTIKQRGLVTTSPSEGEKASKGYLDRMTAAEAIMGQLTAAGFRPANEADTIASKLPLISNYAVSTEYQQYRQAQEDWVRAKLRKESGAVIGDQEMQREIDTYFPKAGDNEKTIAQKAASRRQAERQLGTSAGILGRGRLRELDALDAPQPDLRTPGAPTPQQAAQPVPTLAPGAVIDGYQYMGGDPNQQTNWQKVGS